VLPAGDVVRTVNRGGGIEPALPRDVLQLALLQRHAAGLKSIAGPREVLRILLTPTGSVFAQTLMQ
jgi:hypothetical protein